MQSEEERRAKDRERSRRRYEKQRQNREWMNEQAAKKRAKYKRKGRTKSHENAKRRNKAIVRSHKLAAGSCHDCGLQITEHNLYKFDFDHRDPTLKKFSLSAPGTYAIETVLEEIAKCDVVCRNCHADRTHGNRDIIHAKARATRKATKLHLINNPELFNEAI
jgi:uncharacterized Fe-S radical SAM superfamily protein PflX